MNREISARQLDMLAQTLPHGPWRLWALLRNLSDDGEKPVQLTNAWYAAALGCSVRSIQRWMQILEGLPGELLTIYRQKIAPEMNLPNIIRIKPLWKFDMWAWAKAVAARLSRKCVKGDTSDTLSLKPYSEKRLSFANVVPGAISLPGELLRLIPDAPRTPARVAWLRKNGLSTT